MRALGHDSAFRHDRARHVGFGRANRLSLVDGRGTDLALELRREGRVGVVVFLASESDHELCTAAAALGRVIQKESGVDELMACVRESLEHVSQLAQAVGSEHSSIAPVHRSGTHKRVR